MLKVFNQAMRKLQTGRIISWAAMFFLLFAGKAVAEGKGAYEADLIAGRQVRLAIGAGVPYGGIGGNLEASINGYLAATLGVGAMDSELGWAGGLRVYPLGRPSTVSPRFSVYYGTIATLDWGDGGIEADAGLSYGMGVDWRGSPTRSFDVELLYIDYDLPGGFVRRDETDFTLAIGYGWFF